ncbi:PAS/PAC sensor hybrid histidine kinase [Caballeronia pedi]|uniref:PAS/PAC sensor hybrid histidine kinase n=1 Tax=Caballeronia pedi TaxID=1777141 RepID=A0A158DSG3_9BURK|nr:response regulator [Caballeronia pedi]SAK97562.1 PAS/PAC sensor hybrid histidine kinase [Caballeronia pedi]
MTTVLFVDDHQDAADSLSAIATALGHHSAVAYDGASAVRLAAETAFDLIFLDVSLPDEDGRDTCERIRVGASQNATVIALTGYAEIRGTQEMQKFDDCFIKPLDIDELESLLNGRG